MSLKRIGLSADAVLFERFKIKCKRDGFSASSVISQFMQAYLGEPQMGGDIIARIAAAELRINQLETKIAGDTYSDDGK